MIKYVEGNLLESDCDVLVNAVNCVGVMGKGIAKQFKEYFGDEYFKTYKYNCINNIVKTGKITYEYFPLLNKIVVDFPTKNDWRNPSKISYIRKGLKSLKHFLIEHKIRSCAIPALGCSNGQLSWQDVKYEIEDILECSELKNCKINVYIPQE
jgi:O-acetyl-ADP-ribose deacetylase (regulator of RNase III)